MFLLVNGRSVGRLSCFCVCVLLSRWRLLFLLLFVVVVVVLASTRVHKTGWACIPPGPWPSLWPLVFFLFLSLLDLSVLPFIRLSRSFSSCSCAHHCVLGCTGLWKCPVTRHKMRIAVTRSSSSGVGDFDISRFLC